MKIKVKESWKTFCRQLLLWQFHCIEKNKEPLLNTTSDSTAIYGLLLTPFQGWDSGPFRHCWWRTLICTWSLCWHLLCALCNFYKTVFGCLVWCWKKQRAHHQHTQHRDPTTPCCTTETTPAAPRPPLISKVSVQSCSHSSSSSFMHTSAIPSCKILSFSSSAWKVLW